MFSNLQGKFNEQLFEIPEKTEQAEWSIRKLINIELSSHKRNTSKIDLKYKPELRRYEEVVYFTAAETNVTNIPTADERNKNVVDQSILRKRVDYYQ